MARKLGVLDRVSRFLRDSSGNFGMMMGLMAFPIIGSMALAVDYSNLMKDTTAAQASLDAAALAAAKEYSSGGLTGETEEETNANIQSYANDYFLANLPDGIDPDDVDMVAVVDKETKTDVQGASYEERSIGLTADIEYDTFLAKTVGHDKLVPQITAQVAVGNITVELALVMDNSGSMGSNSRLTTAKTTSKDMVDNLFAAGANSNKPDPIKISLVPFAAMVNVGTDNKKKNWMDKKGWAPTHHENLDWDTYVVPDEVTNFKKFTNGESPRYRQRIDGKWQWMTRHSVFDMLGTEWAGCVEARPWPHNTQDTVQLTNNNYNGVKNGWKGGAGLDALFVPNFAPSEPSRKYRWSNGSGYWDSYYYSWNQYLYRSGWNYLGDWRKPTDGGLDSVEWIDTGDNFSQYGSEYDEGVIQGEQNLRQDWIWRYQAAAIDDAVHIGSNMASSNAGPNFLCSTEPLTELTDDKDEIKDAIDDMRAQGATNVQEGIAWGWRTLSSSEPFTGGRGYDDPDNRKYIVVLTDGNNWMGSSSTPNQSAYSAWGYGKNGRMDEGLETADRPELYKDTNLNTSEKKMNVHTLQTCENVKAAGITIFTIAFDVRDGSSVKELLQACGGSGLSNGRPLIAAGEFYYDVDGAKLDDAMAAITSQISDMRLRR